MQLTCGQKVMLQASNDGGFINGRICGFFHLTEDDVQWLRHKSPIWAHVRAGDRAFHYNINNETPSKERDFTPRVFVLGYADVYLCMR